MILLQISHLIKTVINHDNTTTKTTNKEEKE